MYLKRLEIQGFKTFPSRTVLEFGPGVTAIIGPNGSGKSNIADAIRWVLGEQSPRLMRMRRLEDALFAGGNRRAPAGFAEVGMVLDNASGWLPLAFDEVSVTRRLHRSGDSEYLINRRRVRLRDINELFLKARLGQNSYAIMGQGLVDQVLSLRPDERRALIEEAADIRRYRVRAHDATERLHSAAETLEKVDLIVAELAPRLAQLERQARRAREHQTLAAELTLTLQQWFGARLRAAECALEQARTASVRSRHALDDAQHSVDERETEVATLAADLAAARGDEQPAYTRLRALEDNLRRTEQRIGLESERLSYVERRLRELEDELTVLSAERDELRTTTVEAVQASLVGFEAARDQVEQLTVQTRALEAETEQAHRAAGEAEALLQRRNAGLRAADDRLAQVRRSLAQAEREASGSAGRCRALVRRLAEYGTSFHTRWRMLASAREEAAQAEERQEQVQQALDAARVAAAASAESLAQAEAELREVNRRLELLTRLQRDLAQHDPTPRLLDLANRYGITVLGRLSEVIDVAQGWESAVEAALGEALTAAIVPDRRQAVEALLRWCDGEGVRFALAPVAGAAAYPPIVLPEEPEVAGPASTLVACAPEYRSLVDALLGHTIIVSDAMTAATLVVPAYATIVTRSGIVFRPDGLITGGRTGAESRLSLERELRELPQQARMAQAAVEERRTAHALAQQTVALARQQLTEAVTTAEQKRRAMNRAQEALLNERARLAPLRGELRHTRQAGAAALARLGPLRDEELQLGRRLEPLRVAVATASAQLREAGLGAKRLGDQREGLFQRLAAARGTLLALERERQAAAAMQESRRIALTRMDERISARTREAEARRRETTQVKNDIARQRAELAQLAGQCQEAQRAAHAARDRARTMAAQHQTAEAELAALRLSAAAAERQCFVKESELSQRVAERDRLLEEIDEAGTSVPAYSSDEQPVPDEPGMTALHDRIRAIRGRIRALGPVNEQAEADYAAGSERHLFLTRQLADLRGAEAGLIDLLDDLRGLVRIRFREAFERIAADFVDLFKRFFGGGAAQLVLTEPERDIESGVDIVARPPGKRLQSLSLLSGGERSMTAVALLFALLQYNPAPFCVLDEVDAALDEANVGRFGQALRGLAGQTQFVVVTHNRVTMESADTIYGVSMGKEGASTVLSLRLADIPDP